MKNSPGYFVEWTKQIQDMYNSRLSFTYNKKIKNICIYFYIHKKTQKAILKTNNNVFTWVYVCVRGWGRRVLG